jgi:hypothetical protein
MKNTPTMIAIIATAVSLAAGARAAANGGEGVPKMKERSDSVAYVGRAPRSSGPALFTGYVEVVRSGDIVAETERAVPLDDALEWANRHTARVVLSYGLSGAHVFSAGASYYDGGNQREPLASWPPSPEVVAAIDAEVASALSQPRSNEERISVVEPLIENPKDSTSDR